MLDQARPGEDADAAAYFALRLAIDWRKGERLLAKPAAASGHSAS